MAGQETAKVHTKTGSLQVLLSGSSNFKGPIECREVGEYLVYSRISKKKIAV